jgi:hypothetical protein
MYMSISRKTKNRVNLGLKRRIFMSKTHMSLRFYVFGNAPLTSTGFRQNIGTPKGGLGKIFSLFPYYEILTSLEARRPRGNFSYKAILGRVVYRFDTGSLAGIGIDILYTGTGRSVFWSVFPGVSKILADVMV